MNIKENKLGKKEIAKYVDETDILVYCNKNFYETS